MCFVCIPSMMLTELLLGIVPTQRHHTICHFLRKAADAGTVAATAVLSTPGAADSPNVSNIGPAAMHLWPPTLLKVVSYALSCLKLMCLCHIWGLGGGQGGQGLRQTVPVLNVTWYS